MTDIRDQEIATSPHGLASRDLSHGRLILGAGVCGVAIAVILAVIGLRMVSGAAGALESSLAVTDGALAVIDDTIVVASQSVGVAQTSLITVRSTFTDVADTFATMSEALDGAAQIVRYDLPATLGAIGETTPTLITTADVIARAAGALAILGVDVDPAAIPTQALREIDTRLATISVGLETAGEQIGAVADDLGAYSSDTVLVDVQLGDAISQLEEVDGLLSRYAATTADAAVVIGTARADLAAQVTTARWMVVLFAVAFGAAQVAPIVMGRRLIETARRQPDGLRSGNG